jgi:hypothetical protein
MPRFLGNKLSDREFAAELQKSFENEIDSDSDETKAELKNTSDPKYVEIADLNGLVCKRGRECIAKIRVPKKVNLHAGRG